jgi:nickel-dependent lactate racemase
VETIQVPYGKSHFNLSVPEGSLSLVACEAKAPHEDDLADILESQTFRRYADHETLCVVNDGTRPTRTRDVIEEGGLSCHYIVATGAHASPTEEELIYIFGPRFEEKRILIHDARRSPCKKVGVTSRGTPVKFNESIFKYERILIIGSVEPHYFAGFTGGRKGLLPGVSAYETIEKNHSHYFSPGATSLRLEGNPVHEDMMEAVGILDLSILSLNMVVGKDNEIVGAFCGSLEDSLSEAAGVAQSYYSVEIAEQADLVIACAPYPMDADLYQTQKALVNAARACKTGGLIVLVSQCRNGIGPTPFYELMTTHGSLEDVLSFAQENYRLGYHKAASFAEILLEHEVKVISDLSSELLPPLHMEAWTFCELKKSIAAVADGGGMILHMPHASVTVPIVVPDTR